MLSLMKTKYFALAALAFAALVSCNKETATVEQIPEPSVREGYVQITLSAGVDNSTVDYGYNPWEGFDFKE